ncbi:MAG: hypothetical protein GY844_10550 [Bradyrhizobium sp.]|nr:hypothetical protein [Bradyrhizobium sp.]
MIRTTMCNRLGALLSVTAALFLAGCETGVKNPEAWLHENISYLNDVVMKLRKSSILRVQSDKYETAAKYSSSDADAALYDELKKFIDRTGVTSISVVRRRLEGDTHTLAGVSFHVKESWKPFELSAVDVVYTEPGVDPQGFFWDASCTKAEAPSWFICPSKPK